MATIITQSQAEDIISLLSRIVDEEQPDYTKELESIVQALERIADKLDNLDRAIGLVSK